MVNQMQQQQNVQMGMMMDLVHQMQSPATPAAPAPGQASPTEEEPDWQGPRLCTRCGKHTYLREGVCYNMECVPWFFPIVTFFSHHDFPNDDGDPKKIFPATAKALSFTRLSADQLGQRLLRWSGHYSGDQQVSSKKVWKTKKKNKGWKREQWWAQVKEYHNKQNDGDQTAANGGGGASPNGDGSMFGNNFPDAPWNTSATLPPPPAGGLPPAPAEVEEVPDDAEEIEPVRFFRLFGP